MDENWRLDGRFAALSDPFGISDTFYRAIDSDSDSDSDGIVIDFDVARLAWDPTLPSRYQIERKINGNPWEALGQ